MLSTILRVNKFHFSIIYKKDVILENKVLINRRSLKNQEIY